MAQKKVSVKHLQIDKSQSTVLGVIVAATVIVVFSLFATKSMITKGLYQKRALHARKDVAATLKDNYAAAQTLFTQYKVFANADPNIIGGTASGGTNLDGSNPVIVLDSLPSVYDAPALATSLEKVMIGRNVTIDSLSVTDDPTTNSDQPQASPQSKAIAFSFEGTTNFAGGTQLLQDFERSIRPFDLNTLEISGTDAQFKMTVGMTTYFQPAKSLDLKATKEVK
jgi:hypothetical protein